MPSESALPNVYEMDDDDLVQEIHVKLSQLDEAVATVFKSHVPVTNDPETLTPLEHSVSIMRNMELTMEALRNQNPMSLIKSLMGL